MMNDLLPTVHSYVEYVPLFLLMHASIIAPIRKCGTVKHGALLVGVEGGFPECSDNTVGDVTVFLRSCADNMGSK